MSANAQSFAPNSITLDPGTWPDGVLRLRISGDTEDRLQLHLDGTLYAGDGATPPTLVSSGGGAGDFLANPTDLEFDGSGNPDDVPSSWTATEPPVVGWGFITNGAASTDTGQARSNSVALWYDDPEDASPTHLASFSVQALADGALALLSLDGAEVIRCVNDGSTNIGFYGATPVTRPVVPATPDAQDIADVLVALGLATQAV